VTAPVIREAGDAVLLLEFSPVVAPEVNARAVAAAAALRREGLAGLRDVVPTYRSVAVHFDPLRADVEALRAALERASTAPPVAVESRTIEVPTVYGGTAGPDLDALASRLGLRADDVVARHAGTTYRVYMLGFLPGFAYLGTVDERIAAPRHSTPRLKVPAGSVGIAGRQTGIYPRVSPGGWQIVGRTALALFDPARTPAALLRPGDHVRFVPVSAASTEPDTRVEEPAPPVTAVPSAGRGMTVLQPGLLTTVQDEGRWGHQASGVPVAGALDRVSARVANALAGNEPGTAMLEVTLVGPELRIDCAARLAVAGADLDARLDGRPLPVHRPVACRAGSVLRFGARGAGARAYVAVDGGVALPTVLGSASTHVLTGLGGLAGRALVAGDRLPLGPARPAPPVPRVEIVPPTRAGGARLRVLPGPQDEYFSESAFELLERVRFTITPQSDRMGYRLAGSRLPRADDREMVSDATVPGGLQVPPSGEPILLMSDRQTTGGYPQMVTVISADLPVAGQLAPGDWVEFARCSRAEALAALIAQEGRLLALE
jgi:KipI family sensor histidine kinase inhibitor